MIEIEAPCCGAPTPVGTTVPDRLRCDDCCVEVDLGDPVAEHRVLAAAA